MTSNYAIHLIGNDSFKVNDPKLQQALGEAETAYDWLETFAKEHGITNDRHGNIAELAAAVLNYVREMQVVAGGMVKRLPLDLAELADAAPAPQPDHGRLVLSLTDKQIQQAAERLGLHMGNTDLVSVQQYGLSIRNRLAEDAAIEWAIDSENRDA